MVFSEDIINCDMAAEAHALPRGMRNKEIPGVEEKIIEQKFTQIIKITIFDEEGVQLMQCPEGDYVTIDAPLSAEDFAAFEEVAFAIANTIKKQ